jgi:hypothetical protein
MAWKSKAEPRLGERANPIAALVRIRNSMRHKINNLRILNRGKLQEIIQGIGQAGKSDWPAGKSDWPAGKSNRGTCGD